MANRKALGRGLKALIPDVPEGKQEVTLAAEAANIQFIEVTKISPNPFQPRATFDPVKLEELKNSIAEKGVIQPITVRRYNNGYQIIAGERRLRSVCELEISTIPAYIMDIESDEDMMELSIIENIHREDLNPIDIATSYRRLIEECHLTQEVIAQKVGKDRATVANFLRLLKLPRQIRESAKTGELSMGHARAILALDDSDAQIEVWKKIVKDGLSVRKVEELVRNYSQPKKQVKAETVNNARTYYLEDVENKLRLRLATKVVVKAKKQGGLVEIEYYNDDDLNRLVTVINGE